MSENKEYLENEINIDETVNEANVANESEDIEFIDYDIDKVSADKSGDTLDLDKPVKPVDVKAEIISWIKMIAVAVIAAFIINNFIIINATVPTGSMENTILAGDRVIGLRLSYIFDKPERGDIVVFKYPLDETKTYIKRVIGLPGETVEIEDSKIKITDTKTGETIVEELKEDYLKEDWLVMNDGYKFEIPEDRYLMIGDNRNHSADAREWQTEVKMYPDVYGTDEDIIYVHEDKILGKAYFSYWSKGKVAFNWIAE